MGLASESGVCLSVIWSWSPDACIMTSVPIHLTLCPEVLFHMKGFLTSQGPSCSHPWQSWHAFALQMEACSLRKSVQGSPFWQGIFFPGSNGTWIQQWLLPLCQLATERVRFQDFAFPCPFKTLGYSEPVSRQLSGGWDGLRELMGLDSLRETL